MRWRISGRGSLFSYVDLEARVPAGHPLRRSAGSSTRCWWRSMPSSRRCMRSRSAVDPTRAIAAGAAPAGVLHDPVRAPADGAARLQSAVSLVRRARHRRCRLGCDRVLKNRDRLLEGDVARRS